MKGVQNYFWGILLIGIGILLILKYQFKLNISMPRIIIGVLFIAMGVSALMGGFVVKNRSDMFFSDGKVEIVDPEKEYNVVFGNMVIDLSTISIDELRDNIQINTIFGNTLIKVNPEIPTVIKISSAFGSGNTPDGSTIVFGDHTYRTGEGTPALVIEANVVFGKIDIVEGN
ncbi:MAG: hypothetical protein GX054_03220 [Clostridiales bacterium]|jgi:hypothetical protein|nr:hypothetical protein [Clostridiales bacterium]